MDIDIRVFNSIIKIMFMVIFAYQIFYVIVAFVKRQPKYTNPIVYHRVCGAYLRQKRGERPWKSNREY